MDEARGGWGVSTLRLTTECIDGEACGGVQGEGDVCTGERNWIGRGFRQKMVKDSGKLAGIVVLVVREERDVDLGVGRIVVLSEYNNTLSTIANLLLIIHLSNLALHPCSKYNTVFAIIFFCNFSILLNLILYNNKFVFCL